MTNDLHWAGAQPLISVEQLLDLRLSGPVAILDARISRLQDPGGKVSYGSGYHSFLEDGHIPGAIFADLIDVFSDPNSTYPFTRPSIESLQHSLALAGIDDQAPVIIYDSLNGAWAARLWWVLKAAGLSRVLMLNGGLGAWKAARQPVAYGRHDSSPPPRTPSILNEDAKRFVELPDILSLMNGTKQSKLICALRQTEFEADHIPGSLSLPYASVLNDVGEIDAVRAEAAAAALNVGKDDDVVIYCGGGINAAGLGIALASAGFHRIAVYDGSLSEWKDDPLRPLKTGGALL